MICAQNGCNNTEGVGYVPNGYEVKFCSRCRKEYGEAIRDHNEIMWSLRGSIFRKQRRGNVRNKFAERLVEGFEMLDPDQDDEDS